MDSKEFKEFGGAMLEFITNYLDNLINWDFVAANLG